MSKTCHLKRISVFIIALCLMIIVYQILFIQENSVKHSDFLLPMHSNSISKDRKLSQSTLSLDKQTRQCEIIHISVVCAGSSSTQQVVILVKSILLHRKNPLHIHFIVNDESKLILSHLFQTWDLPDFTISFYMIENHMKTVSWIPNTHYSGVYGLLKLAILDILPTQISKVILLDTDIVFASDIVELWYQFDKFEKAEAVGLVENQSDWYSGTLYKNYIPWPALGNGFNTGVMLLKCDKLRQWDWNFKWQKVAKVVLQDLLSTVLADQDIVNSVIKQYPFLVHTLPCYWNLQMSDNMKPELCYMMYPNEIKGLHFNARKKYKAQQTRFKSIKNLYQRIIELNGELVRLPNLNCRSVGSNDRFLESDNDFTEDDGPCREFRSSSSNLYRTHLYFFPFESVKTDDVSIVVHLSVDRFPMFEKLCTYWEGPVSAAIFVSDSDTQRLLSFVEMSEVLSNRKNIAYHFVFKKANEEIYPINLLRNIALRYAITEYIFLYDVDFSPMPGLYQYIASHLSFSTNQTDLTAFIIPAFESLLYKFEMPTTKSELLKDLSGGSITTFRSYMWPKGHAATNFTKWKLATHAYDVRWEQDFEPYVVVQRSSCPPYDKRFSGFGWNKISHIMELDAAGFTFTVLPFGFIVHLPHSPSIDLIKYRTVPNYRECLRSAKVSFIEHLSIKYDVGTKYFELYDDQLK